MAQPGPQMTQQVLIRRGELPGLQGPIGSCLPKLTEAPRMDGRRRGRGRDGRSLLCSASHQLPGQEGAAGLSEAFFQRNHWARWEGAQVEGCTTAEAMAGFGGGHKGQSSGGRGDSRKLRREVATVRSSVARSARREDFFTPSSSSSKKGLEGATASSWGKG